MSLPELYFIASNSHSNIPKVVEFKKKEKCYIMVFVLLFTSMIFVPNVGYLYSSIYFRIDDDSHMHKDYTKIQHLEYVGFIFLSKFIRRIAILLVWIFVFISFTIIARHHHYIEFKA